MVIDWVSHALMPFWRLQVKAMEIIDQLETSRRGPYGGGIGHVGFNGSMDIALALRTMVIPTAAADSLYSYNGAAPRRDWTVHLQVKPGCSSLVIWCMA